MACVSDRLFDIYHETKLGFAFGTTCDQCPTGTRTRPATRYFFSIPDPTRLSFENHRVAGNPKYRVLPDISGKPEVSGIPIRVLPNISGIPRHDWVFQV